MVKSMVSIVIPVYNTEKYLSRCINSILEQTYDNIELIIVNDGSTGMEENIIHKFMEEDSRIKYIKNTENKGLFLTRIRGVNEARGEYIAFVDSDDYIGVDFLRLLVEQMEETGVDITFASTVNLTIQGKFMVNSMQEVALNVLPLSGEDIKKYYFGQSGSAYVWHTIWNKLYRRSLWVKCLPYLNKLDKHIVMTEDIAFSTILLFFAKAINKVDNSIYYYCQNEDSSTNSNNISFNSYRKKISDITEVFNFVDDFLKLQGGINQWFINKFVEFRRYYARMWKRGIINIQEQDKKDLALILVNNFYNEPGDERPLDDGYFNTIMVPYSNKLENIKRKILKSHERYISFDIFDTVVKRPFYRPTDLFYLLDKEYEKYQDTNTSFHLLRLDGEAGARQILHSININDGSALEDIKLEDIYSYIGRAYYLSEKVCYALMEEEKQLEIHFCQVRKTVKEIYDIAKLSGKKIIFISDMYLDIDTIKTILHKNGYYGFEKIFLSSECGKLKATGNLYKHVLNELDLSGDELIHIGDNYISDIKKAEEYGVSTIYIPKTIDVFENKIEDLKTNSCAFIGKRAAGPTRDVEGLEKINGYGSMIAIIANQYFDNPFRSFHPMTDFNIDPFFAGHYLLGMSLIGIISWIENLEQKNNFNKIYFMSRDGFLIKKAYDLYLNINRKHVNTGYLYASRKSMLSMILASKTDFMNLPIVYQKYSPDMINELLNFCIRPLKDSELNILYRENNIIKNKKFNTIDKYHEYISFFLMNLYDEKYHLRECEKIKRYLNEIESNDLIFDMGYSASIHNSIVRATNKTPAALFIHSDKDKHHVLSRRGKFEIYSLFDYIPNISGILREFLYSDLGGSCIAYQEVGDAIEPIFEDIEKKFTDIFPILQMQRGAIQFCNDYITCFKDYWDFIDIRVQDVVLPLEGFIRTPTKIDTKMFSASYFEDKVYGALTKMNVRKFWLMMLSQISGNNFLDITRDIKGFMAEKGKKKLAFFGTGKMCQDILESYNIPIDLFVDNDMIKHGKFLNSIEIRNPNYISDWNQYFIVIVCAAYLEIEEQLEKIGLTKYDDFASYIEIF